MIYKIKKCIPGIILADTAIFVLAFIMIYCILGICGLMFRSWMYIITTFIIITGVITGIIQLILKLKNKLARIISIIIFAILLFFAVPIGIMSIAFCYNPEYVVEKDGQKYIIYEDSFFITTVYYYDYKNFIVAGNRIRIEEYYGKNRFSPDDMDANKENIENIIYYDKN